MYNEYCKRAALLEEFDLESPDGEACFIAVNPTRNDWPTLVVAQRFSPSGCFHPGVLVVPEKNILFVGAGQRILAYELGGPSRVWEDTADTGFWGWKRYGDTVLMSAELEFAAWDIAGRKLWTMFVEPPWEYHVSDRQVHLDVMGRKSNFRIDSGPKPDVLSIRPS
jgi:hypothetical protein